MTHDPNLEQLLTKAMRLVGAIDEAQLHGYITDPGGTLADLAADVREAVAVIEDEQLADDQGGEDEHLMEQYDNDLGDVDF